VASLAANVAVAEPTITGRVIAAWPSFSLIAAYELLLRQVCRAADGAASERPTRRSPGPAARAATTSAASDRVTTSGAAIPERGTAGRDLQLEAWRWARDNRTEDGSLPSGRDIGSRYGRHERRSTSPPASWWPGSNYVTWIGIDGFYDRRSDTFGTIFGPTIAQVRELTNRPILITQTAVSPHAGQPAKIHNLFSGIEAYGLLGLVWFNQDQHSNGRDWQIQDNSAAERSFQRAASALNASLRHGREQPD
jgi:hypothetical protein